MTQKLQEPREQLLKSIQAGRALERQGRLVEAQTWYETALSHFPASAELHNNLGNVYKRQEKNKQALVAYQKANQLNPTLAEPYNNIGMLLQMRGDSISAIDYFKQSLKANPQYAVARMNLAMSKLLQGQYDDAWPNYEARRLSPDFPKWDQTKDLKPGLPVSGRTILVYSEQGYGDTFQFIRYLPLLKAQGARVILATQPGLSPLLQSCEGIDSLIEAASDGECELSYDAHIPLLSLPAHFQTDENSIPAQIPYIQADPQLVQHWKPQFREIDLNIGIVWSGSPSHANNTQRSCPLPIFKGLSRIGYAHFFSLQKGPLALEAHPDTNWTNLRDLSPDIQSFSDTAAIIATLDLVITVDTAVAHLAGALGKPVWVALSAVPDWRWGLDTPTSAWYPSMQLYRQKQLGDWQQVIVDICDRLKHLDKRDF